MNAITLIFVAVIIILIGHTYSGCHNPYALIEGMEDSVEAAREKTEKEENPSKLTKLTDAVADLAGFTTQKDGFTTRMQSNIGQYAPYSLASSEQVDTSSWGQPDLTIRPGKPESSAVRDFLNRPEQPVPLPAGEMLLFKDTQFKPECCPNTYSTSTGCACMTGKQYNYLILRGNNNVPYSEY